MRYLLAARDLVLPDGLREMSRPDLLIRQIGLPSLQALSHLTDRPYLASLAPVFGLSGLGFFAGLTWEAAQKLPRRRRLQLVGAAVLFLGASNRLVYDSFYINTHIQMAVFLLVAIAGFWLAASGSSAWAVPAGIALGVTLLLRPEAPLVAATVLVVVGASRAGWPTRLSAVVPTFLIAVLWYGAILWSHSPGGNTVSLTAPVFGSLVAVGVATALVLAGGFRRLQPLTRWADLAMLFGLVAALGIFAAGRTEVLLNSVIATALNLAYRGIWLLSWPVALALLLVALIVHRVPLGRMWTVPIGGFGLLFFLLPLLRDGAYRLGSGDSGNRILAHFFPVVVAFLVLAAAGEEPMTEATEG
jgi:hypothetical protein